MPAPIPESLLPLTSAGYRFVYSPPLPTPFPDRLRTRYSHNAVALHSLFHTPSGNRGNLGTLTSIPPCISKTPQFHSLNLEILPTIQLHAIKALHPNFHFSCLNDGYYYLFSLILIPFPLPRRARNAPLNLRLAPTCRIAVFAGRMRLVKPQAAPRNSNSLGIQRSTLVFHARSPSVMNTIKKKKR